MNKKIITAAAAMAAAVMAATSVTSYAATENENSPSGKTEVKANITSVSPGDVTYTITIPDVVDFGELTIPEDTSTDNYKDVDFTVEATEITGLDPSTHHVSVYVRGEDAAVGIETNGDFCLKNKADESKKFPYEVYGASNTIINSGSMTKAVGYLLTSFSVTGETMSGKLRFDQNQLKAYDITDIYGEYSGYMVFFSTIESNS